MPEWLTSGMTIGGGMVVAVGYAMVINMMSSREVWPFFFAWFCSGCIKELTLISLGIIGLTAPPLRTLHLKLVVHWVLQATEDARWSPRWSTELN